MGFFASGATASKSGNQLSTELLHQLGCRACPLDKIKANKHPHMEPTGSDRPVVYMLGEAPSKDDDEADEHFAGQSGRLLRALIPRDWEDDLRWNHVVRTMPPNDRKPSHAEIECCRPSIIKDIEATKPKAIFCFGSLALSWLTSMTRIEDWRGRRLPVKVGDHVCWCYVFTHPDSILALKNAKQSYSKGLEDEKVLATDLAVAFEEIDGLSDPVVHDREDVDRGIEIYTGKPGDLVKLEKALHWAAQQDTTGVDYETNMVRPYGAGAKILTAAVGTDKRSFAFAIHHRQAQWSESERKRVLELWVEFILSEARKAVHFLRFEQEWSGFFYGWDLVRAPGWHDTASQASVLDERTSGDDDNKARGRAGEGGPFSLKFLVRQHFGFDLKALSDGLDKGDLDNEPIEDVLWYNAGDAKYHCLLFLAQEERIKKAGFGYLYEELLGRVPTTVLTQLQGVPINQVVSERLYLKYRGQLDDLADQIAADPDAREFKKDAAVDFKSGSDNHCVHLFRDILGCKEGYRGESRYAVDEDVLGKIDRPIARLIVLHRKAAKKLSTYVYRNDPKKGKLILWPDGKLHPNLNTVRVRTRRLCLRKGTKITIPGGYKNIEDIRPGDWVYAFDIDRRLTLKKVIWAGYTGRRKCLRVHWKAGGSHRCGYIDATPNHPIRLIGGTYIQVKDLKGGKPSPRVANGFWGGEHVLALHRQIGVRNVLHATNHPGMKEARFIFETINGWSPEEVHHKNLIPNDDHPDNLEGLSRSAHKSLHIKMISKAELSRRMRSRGPDALARNAEAVRIAGKKRALENKEWIEAHFTEYVVRDAVLRGNGVMGAARILRQEFGCDYSVYGYVRACMDRWDIQHDGRSTSPLAAAQRDQLHASNIGKKRSDTTCANMRAAWKTRKLKYNHMIYKVEQLPGSHPVYDLEVEEVHNFIANELCVHNSADDPNLQNIPKRIEKDKEAKEVREQIEAPPGHVIVDVDYGQIQARNIAMESKDPRFVKALWDRYDVHADWARRIAEAYPARIGGREYLDDPKVMKDFRNDPIKSGWTFGLFFGSRLESAAEYCKVPVEVMRPLFKDFRREFAGVFEWHDRMKQFYDEHGYVEDSFGFRYNAPLTFNQIINSPIQGLEALFVMRAMGNLSKIAHEADDYYYQPHFQVHDSLLFILPTKKVDGYVEEIVTEMLSVTFPFVNVPMTAEVSMGPNLLHMEHVLDAASDTW